MKKISIFILAASTVFFSSCESDDKVIDEVFADLSRGAVLRTVNLIQNELPIGDTEGFFSVELEEQDDEGGALLSSVEAFATFIDNTDENGPGSSSEGSIGSIPASAFTVGPNGLPRLVYSATLAELTGATGVALDDVQGGDVFNVRFNLVLTDGREYSVAQNSGTIEGSYYNSPFRYNATVVCPPAPPAVGTWIFSTTDAYGDSWNGASLNVSLDGADPIVIANEDADGVSPGSETIEYTVDCTRRNREYFNHIYIWCF